ncbi:hypothetical protein JOB18_035240 [Solea senegalensis]|uniref:Secreted protein n=1 Tax=Solea senegalensis TaxID=28829 RepID=A0AAV6PUK6_SOLSE|nr:hypothetical protein JOB18_035240 [Solea senegalensis]
MAVAQLFTSALVAHCGRVYTFLTTVNERPCLLGLSVTVRVVGEERRWFSETMGCETLTSESCADEMESNGSSDRSRKVSAVWWGDEGCRDEVWRSAPAGGRDGVYQWGRKRGREAVMDFPTSNCICGGMR